jgi:hypothetical protein
MRKAFTTMAKSKKRRGKLVVFIGRDKEVRTGEIISSSRETNAYLRTDLHPISGLPMVKIEVTEGPDVGAIYWVMADKADDVLGVMSQIL